MATLDDLQAAITTLVGKIDSLIARVTSGPAPAPTPTPEPVDVQPEVDEVNAAAAKIDAALGGTSSSSSSSTTSDTSTSSVTGSTGSDAPTSPSEAASAGDTPPQV